jgi:DNA-binding CsgD family transcriptional regulator
MPSPSPITEDDVRHIIRILGDVAAMKPDSDSQRIHLMNELAALLGTDTWVWGVAPMLDPGKQPVFLYQHTGGMDPERMARFLKAVEHPDTGVMTAPLPEAINEATMQVTRAMQQVVSRERFENSPSKPLWDAADIGEFLFVLRAVVDYGFSCIAFYRPLGAAEFSERDSRIAHIILNEVPLLHQVGMPHAVSRPIPQLPPRCRLIINLLVRGQSRATIAGHLGISQQTVNGYVKQIFRHFDVHSQSELIARLTKGDGGDR